MEKLKSLILSHEDWLIDRVVHHAHQHDQTRFTSTLREAWRTSIAGLSQPLVASIDEALDNHVQNNKSLETAVAFGREQARKHRWRGTDLAMFLELLKLYRGSYFELIEENVPDPEERQPFNNLLLQMFDSVELGLTREWSMIDETVELARLREEVRALSNEKNRLLTMVESIAEPVILLDTKHRPTYVNAAGAATLLGETSPGASYYGSADMDRLATALNDILDEIARHPQETRTITLPTPTGDRQFSISVQEMLDISHKFSGQVIILNDVTNYLKAIAAAEDGNRAKSAFLATVSHEVKTPINSILGLAEILDDGSLSDSQGIHLDAVRSSAKVLAELTENILGLSRAEANALQRLDQDFDLCETMETLRKLYAPEAEKAGLTINFEIAPGVPCHLHGDVGKLRHVLMNLLSNAVKFTSHGSVSLGVHVLGGGADKHPTIRFEVADTGVGLPSGGLDWLFTPFAQYAHPGISVVPRGSGLGLAICKRMVDFLGGRISGNPNPGGGSVFWFEIPFRIARAPARSESPRHALSVLVVEDDPVSALVTEGHLSDLGHVPVVVPSYDAALSALHRQRFDLVVTDHRLDGNTGLNLAAEMHRKNEQALKDLPVILVTADIPPEATHDHPDVRCFIEKPITRQHLDLAIRQVMARTSLDQPPAKLPNASSQEATTTGGDAALPVLDHETLKRLVNDLGIERSDRIVKSFLASAPSLCDTLSRGIADEDLGLVTLTAHQILSGCGYVGLQSIAETAHRLQNCGTVGDIRLARRLVHDLNREVDNGRAALSAHWQELCLTSAPAGQN